MYVPPHFRDDDLASLYATMRDFPLATFVSHAGERIHANHVPMLIDPSRGPYGTLVFHLARANPQWRAIDPQAEALAIFAGPDAYVSPAWYAAKAETGKVVPTWNYVAVHAHGTVRVFDDRDALRALVERLTTEHEASRDDPWSVDDAPAEFVEGQLRAIVGLELTIVRIEGKAKLSQNRPPSDRETVADALATSDRAADRATADAMRARSR